MLAFPGNAEETARRRASKFRVQRTLMLPERRFLLAVSGAQIQVVVKERQSPRITKATPYENKSR